MIQPPHRYAGFMARRDYTYRMVEVPPAVALLLDEFREPSLDLANVSKKFNDAAFRKDVFDQCLAGVGFAYADLTPVSQRKFSLYATGGLSPLSGTAKCMMPECRLAYAAHFASTSCVYADEGIVTDEVSWGAWEWRPKSAFIQIGVLKMLQPLVEAGVVRFGSPALTRCEACSKVAKAAAARLTRELWKEFLATVDVFLFKQNDRWRFSFGSPLLYANGEETRHTVLAPRELRVGLKPRQMVSGRDARNLARALQPVLRPPFSTYAHNLVFETSIGSRSGAAIATSAHVEVCALRHLDGPGIDATRIPDWLNVRSIPMTTLTGLRPHQVLELRETARKALPAFRTRLRRDLLLSKRPADDAEAERVAAALALEAREVEAELGAVHLSAPRRRERLLTVLGALLQVVALGSKSPELILATSGTFAAALLAAHQGQADRERHNEKLIHQPAYVVVAAERIHGEH